MSPSLDTRENRVFASELKFLVSPVLAEQILDWARARLGPDPHAGGRTGDTYHITSLYCDTAYVIFAVVVGMAVGARDLWVGLIGIGVVGLAAYLMAARAKVFSAAQPALVLSLRVGLGHELETLLGGTLNAHLQDRELISVGTAKQGAALEVIYEARLKTAASPEAFVKSLNRLEGVQSVQLRRRDFEKD